jgi:hypothetical protein
MSSHSGGNLGNREFSYVLDSRLRGNDTRDLARQGRGGLLHSAKMLPKSRPLEFSFSMRWNDVELFRDPKEKSWGYLRKRAILRISSNLDTLQKIVKLRTFRKSFPWS